jgi:forkhead box protein J2/3
MMPPPGLIAPFPEDAFDVDEHGNIDWHRTWKKELAQLLQVTEQQEKAGADQEWYKMMLWRLKSAFMPPPMQHGDAVVHVPGPPPPHVGQHHGHIPPDQQPRP